MQKANQHDGILLCKLINEKLTGVYPALTGGLLYKDGDRKDIDIVLYRHRQDLDCFEVTDFEKELNGIGVKIMEHYGFVTKCEWLGYVVDLFNPETKLTSGQEYGEE